MQIASFKLNIYHQAADSAGLHAHGGKSKGTTCVVDRDVTAYLVVGRVLRLPTEQYGRRYGGHPGFNDVKVNFLGIFCYFTFRICF